jgi:5'-nucleotidase
MDPSSVLPPLERRVFCNRTLNLRSIQAVGCDMDYTLVHYNTDVWEGRAYAYAQARLVAQGWPVGHLVFDAKLSSLGLIIDVELGNVIKVNRFGHVRQSSHGTSMLSFQANREAYTTAPVELGDDRFRFLDTLFSLSEACLYAQLIDMLDLGLLQAGMSYRDLYEHVRAALDATHLEGKLKAEIVANPERYVVIDTELPQALLDLKQAGKKLLLITNSEWEYTQAMMSYCFDPYLPAGTTWRTLFDLVVVQARKPTFFSTDNPGFLLVDESGLLRSHVGAFELGNVYVGGNARLVERGLNLRGDSILYIGDHIFADVHASKDLLRWRTALVVRELEEELRQLRRFSEEQAQLEGFMRQKMLWEHEYSQTRLRIQRSRFRTDETLTDSELDALRVSQERLRASLVELDLKIVPVAQRSSQLVNARWGQLMRAGSDKSHLARQIERYADVYMSRVSNLLAYTPFVYLRAPRGSLPHDAEVGTEWE